ncbi:zinc-ribbon and DUF3426 domain-containing protein [Pelistega ratti]|uniref:zinc-ribbon and DUF3426 domain-containing protein n=1 Tax=Pelistega ratti TaxID=2652177 RepID=UPI001FA9E5F9|nr:zinc-ribbon and DUF3426 domain-containing protein [Pelistega ratti]
MMKTRCPICDTVLKVNQQQVEQRQGMVRCGVCRQVFNAVEHLYEEEDYPILTEEDTPEEEAGAIAIQKRAVPSPRVEEHRTKFVEGITTTTHTEPVSHYKEPVIVESVYQPQPSAQQAAVHIHLNNTQPTAQQRDRIGESNHHYIGSRSVHDGRAYDEPFSVQGERAYSDEYERESHSSFIWLIIALVALLLMVGQFLYVFRNQLASAFPKTQPFITQLCSLLKCEVNLQKSAHSIGLENASLSEDKSRTVKVGEYALLLHVTLVNKTASTQEWPVLGLSLKNETGAVMSSRNIMPKDYLVADQLMKPFMANTKVPITVPFVFSGQMVKNYEINVFYH